MAKRIDTPDTVDPAVGLIHRLQAEGWGLERLDHEVEYVSPGDKHRKIPVAATVTIRLVPGWRA